MSNGCAYPWVALVAVMGLAGCAAGPTGVAASADELMQQIQVTNAAYVAPPPPPPSRPANISSAQERMQTLANAVSGLVIRAPWGEDKPSPRAERPANRAAKEAGSMPELPRELASLTSDAPLPASRQVSAHILQVSR